SPRISHNNGRASVSSSRRKHAENSACLQYPRRAGDSDAPPHLDAAWPRCAVSPTFLLALQPEAKTEATQAGKPCETADRNDRNVCATHLARAFGYQLAVALSLRPWALPQRCLCHARAHSRLRLAGRADRLRASCAPWLVRRVGFCR